MTTGITAAKLISYSIVIPEWAIFLLAGLMVISAVLKIIELILKYELFKLTRNKEHVRIMEKLLAKLKEENDVSAK